MTTKRITWKKWSAAAAGFMMSGSALMAQETPAPNSGDTAWMLTSTALVLLMTLPGLALFYGGLVRSKNVLSVLMQCFAIAAVMSVVWTIFGYAVASGGPGNLGLVAFDKGKLFLNHMKPETLSGTIPESVFVTFQMTFIIITPALIIGAFAERMRFIAVMVFCTVWSILAYLPIWHMAWDVGNGLFSKWGALDFAGGTVVHINAGIAALVACIMVGKRSGYGSQHMAPHNVPLVLIGAGLLWVGWFGFNAGSAVGANAAAGFAMITTQLATAAAVLGWVLIEWITKGKPTAIGAATGAVAGLVAITPASGSTTVIGSLVIGFVAAIICYIFSTAVKKMFKYDDALDVFGVHGVGGIVGALLTGIFIREGAGTPGIGQLIIQAKSVGVTIVWSAIAAVIACVAAMLTGGLRVKEEAEFAGLDTSDHGETGYNL